MKKIIRIGATNTSNINKRKVAAYARVSVDYEANLQSLSTQVNYYTSLIKSRVDWEFAGIFSDEGISGTKVNRPGFQELLNQCNQGNIDMIITKSISRLNRNTVDLLATVRSLKEKGINVYFERENINTISQDGELFLSLLASFAQEESRSISENTKWAIRKRFEEGIFTHKNLYGYRWDGQEYEIVEEEAEAIRLIFNSYHDGMSPGQIVKLLNSKGFKPMNSDKFCYESVWLILRQINYTGDSILQKTFIENHLNHKKKINKGELPKYYVEDTHPVIIEKELFNKVQTEIERRKALGYRANQSLTFNCFTSKLHCSICGKTYRKRSNSNKSSTGKVCKYTRWVCGTKIAKTARVCPSCNVPDKVLHQLAAEVINSEVLDEELFDSLIEKITVGDYELFFHFKDGQIVKKTWQTKKNHKTRIKNNDKESKKDTSNTRTIFENTFISDKEEECRRIC
ncbi:MAG: recombinase family protein [Sphaerochaetaceae bacterium]|nr:recombinase family protein [Sphaerochaetaceae bacterium]